MQVSFVRSAGSYLRIALFLVLLDYAFTGMALCVVPLATRDREAITRLPHFSTLVVQNSYLTQISTSGPSAAEQGDPVLKGVAEGALPIVALGFAAFTFLYNTLLVITGPEDKISLLKAKLRRALFATVFAIVSSSVLAVLAFASLEWKLAALGDTAIGLAVVVLAVLSYIAVSMAWDVYRKV